MIRSRDDNVGRFSVNVEIANNKDIMRSEDGLVGQDKVRRITVRGVFDTGATRLVLPERVVHQLGLPVNNHVTVRYADGRTAQRPLASGIQLTYGGRTSVFNAVVEPDRDSALIGAIVLEDLDFIVDCTTQTLVPRDPKHIISEIE